MNRKRREVLRRCVQELQSGDWFLKLERVKDTVESILAEEGDAIDNIPENLQNTDRYSSSEEAVDNLENAIEHLESAFQDSNEHEVATNKDIEAAIGYLRDIL